MMTRLIIALFPVLFITACVSTGVSTNIEHPNNLVLIDSGFESLPNWNNENFKNFAIAYQRSCDPILKRNSQDFFGKETIFGKNQQWQIACRKFQKINQNNTKDIKLFFEQNFTPYKAMAGKNPKGLFTGYYEASLNGSLTRKGQYQYPLHERPEDLVMVNLGEFRDELKGQRIAGRVKSGQLKPYETHAEIVSGKMPKDQEKVLVWVDSAVDAFFIQIQGSGIVTLDNGELMRVGYAGQNGHPYYAIGRELVKRGELEKDSVSMQSIRQWLEQHADQAQDLMQTNKSYVFFKKLEGDGPIGGQGVALTPERSLAIDRSIIPYGVPVWLDLEGFDGHQESIRRLMITQDTGGAIRGAVRGDFFWGYGGVAEKMAGNMNSKGSYWLLLPK